MATIQSILDRARLPLNDSPENPAERRYPDSQLLIYCQDALLAAYRKRPDLYIGQLSAVATLTSLTALSTFPLSDEYIQPMADFITMRAELVDDEYSLSARADGFYKLFLGG